MEIITKPSVLDVSLSITFNVVASCGTIFVNKYLFQNLGFKFGTILTVIHFVITFLLLATCGYFKVFEFKKLEILRVLPICFAFCGYVVFNNISLVYNSVSFYQVMKILCTPFIIAIEYYLYNKSTSKDTLYSLIPVCVGIFITVITDMEINLVGTIFALLAVGANSFYTVFGKTKQNELKANPQQILLYQSAISAVILSFFIPFFDDMPKLMEYNLTLNKALWILVSACFAAGVNFSFFLLVGKTSPLSFAFFFFISHLSMSFFSQKKKHTHSVNVVGYLKTCIVFIGGVLFFAQDLNIKNLFGVGLTLLGVLWYTKVKVEEEQKKIQEQKKGLNNTDTQLPIIQTDIEKK